MLPVRQIEPSLSPFIFEGYNVRIHMDDAGEPWWVASDVCTVLGLSNVSDAVGRLEKDEKRDLMSIGKTETALIINESGLYRLIFRSNKSEAKRFQKWVFSEVLPQIRRAGRYEPSVSEISSPNLRLLFEQIRAMEKMTLDLDRAQTEARLAHEKAENAREMASQAMQMQMYMTIREYVMFNGLTRQLPPGTAQQSFGKFLVGHCREKGWPLRKMPTENSFTEWAYPVPVIQDMIFGWLSRQNSQLRIDVDEDGVWYNNNE